MSGSHCMFCHFILVVTCLCWVVVRKQYVRGCDNMSLLLEKGSLANCKCVDLATYRYWLCKLPFQYDIRVRNLIYNTCDTLYSFKRMKRYCIFGGLEGLQFLDMLDVRNNYTDINGNEITVNYADKICDWVEVKHKSENVYLHQVCQYRGYIPPRGYVASGQPINISQYSGNGDYLMCRQGNDKIIGDVVLNYFVNGCKAPVSVYDPRGVLYIRRAAPKLWKMQEGKEYILKLYDGENIPCVVQAVKKSSICIMTLDGKEYIIEETRGYNRQTEEAFIRGLDIEDVSLCTKELGKDLYVKKIHSIIDLTLGVSRNSNLDMSTYNFFILLDLLIMLYCNENFLIESEPYALTKRTLTRHHGGEYRIDGDDIVLEFKSYYPIMSKEADNKDEIGKYIVDFVAFQTKVQNALEKLGYSVKLKAGARTLKSYSDIYLNIRWSIRLPQVRLIEAQGVLRGMIERYLHANDILYENTSVCNNRGNIVCRVQRETVPC